MGKYTQMTLDIEFKKQTNKLIRETLDLYKNAGVSPRISEVWHSKNTKFFQGGVIIISLGAILLPRHISTAGCAQHKAQPHGNEKPEPRFGHA